MTGTDRPVERGRRRGARVVSAVPLPRDGLLTGTLSQVDAGDAFGTELLAGDTRCPDTWVRALLLGGPAWVRALMRVRDALVRPFGLRTSRDARVAGTFPVLARTPDEVLLGLDDTHLSFRAVVRLEPGRVVVATVVQRHNAVGRAYWGVVRWFHPVVVRSSMRRVRAPLP